MTDGEMGVVSCTRSASGNAMAVSALDKRLTP